MTADGTPLAPARSKLASLKRDWDARRADLGTQWTDARAQAIDAAHLAPAKAALDGLDQALTSQDEADAKARGLCRIVGEQAPQVDQLCSELVAAVEEARARDGAARSAAHQAVGLAASSREQVADALRLVGGAGRDCGQAIGAQAAAQSVQKAVVHARKVRALRQMSRAAAVEVAWQVGPELAGRLAERVTGTGGWSFDGVRDTWELIQPVLHADVADVVRLGLRGRR